MKIAVLGYGTVGSGVVEVLDVNQKLIASRAKEEIESEEGKALLKKRGIEGDYEGIGHCVLGYAAAELPAAKPRKENYVYYVEA